VGWPTGIGDSVDCGVAIGAKVLVGLTAGVTVAALGVDVATGAEVLVGLTTGVAVAALGVGVATGAEAQAASSTTTTNPMT